jgi:hypothetical protein
MTKNKINRIVISTALFIAFLFPAIYVRGQHNESVTVVSQYQPVVSDANKLLFTPSITDTSFDKLQTKYTIISRKARTGFTVEPIKAAKIGDATVPKLYRFLLKAGFGNYTTPYGEFYYNNKQSKSYSIGTHVKYLGSYGKLKGYGDPDFNNTVAEVYGRKFFSKHVLSGNIGYNRDVVHYYGFKPADYATPPSKNDIKQRFSLIKVDAHLNSLVNPDSLKLNHSVDISYYNLMDKYGTSENNIFVGGDVNKELRLIKITKSQVIGLGAKVDYYFNTDSSISHNCGLITLNPYLRTKFKAFTFNIGLDATFQLDTTTSFHFYPIADFQLNIVKDILIIYGGIKGGMKQNSFRSLTDENPFITGISPLKPTKTNIDIFAGIRSNISRELYAHAWASYAVMKDLPLFVVDTNKELGIDLGNKFTVIYDNANVFHIRGEIGWQKAEKIYLRVGGDFWNYDMKTEMKAWHKPYFDIFMNFRYNIASKFIITADLYAYSDRWAKRYTATTVAPEKMKAYLDGNIGIEYRYSKILSAFLNVNNIGSSRYQKWNNYPSYGINILGGVTYAF